MMSNAPQNISIHCAECDGQNVRADAYAGSNVATQQWDHSNTFDARICDDCGNEVSAYERVISDQRGAGA